MGPLSPQDKIARIKYSDETGMANFASKTIVQEIRKSKEVWVR